MLKVRTTKTASHNIAVQVVWREHQNTKVVKHIGTAKSKQELKNLLQLADQYVVEEAKITPLFPELFGIDKKQGHLVLVEQLNFTHVYHNFAYEFLSFFYELSGFNELSNNLLKDLSFIRIIEPASKLRSTELIQEYFGIKYGRNTVYRGLVKIKLIKKDIERIAVNYAKNNLNFDFSLVFYDVTTLYFETFKDDALRKPGFSKDGKSSQPQILIALVVNRDGYPIAIDIFEGNKFEGHTIIPVILQLKKRYEIEKLTVVADAAMLSYDNLEDLKRHGLHYIVAARLSSLSRELLQEASTFLGKKEGIYFHKETEYGRLICDYSEIRASKDRSDRNKQIVKAQNQINNPSKVTKRLRFVKEKTKSVYELNQELIEKDQLLDGIKGYYTNLKNTKDELIVSRYKDLWIIEKSFRIAKSDLAARPIFHRKKDKVEAHVLIVFLSLCVSKAAELLTGLSIKKIRDTIWKVMDIEFVDKLTNKKFVKRMDVTGNKMVESLEKLKESNTY